MSIGSKKSCDIAGHSRSWTITVRLGWRSRGVIWGNRKVSIPGPWDQHPMGLGCCTYFWAPHYQKDTDEPEKVCWGKPSFMITWLKKTAYESCSKMNGLALKWQHEEPGNSLQTFEMWSESKEITYLAWSKELIFGNGNYENQIARAADTQC